MLLTLLHLFLGVLMAGSAADLDRWATRQPYPGEHPEVAQSYRFAGPAFAEVVRHIAERPGWVEVEAFGESVAGEPLWAFHVRDPTVPVERKVLVFAGIHALEWIATETALDFLHDAIDHPVPGVQVTVIPLLNPDGRAKTERDLMKGKRAYRRGNLKNVDLNRDFAVHRTTRAVWKAIIPGYYATSKAPLSQPETRALDALVGRERYDRAASLHAFGGFFYYPWSGRFRPPPDRDEFVLLGRAMQAAMGERAYKLRQLGRWGFFFRALGSEIDHLYGKWGVRAFLIEITRSGVVPHRPKTWNNYFRWYNPVDPAPHRERVTRSLRALVRYPALPSERERGDAPPEPVPSR